MKTSNYILISFFIFIIASLTTLHVDSKLYEDVYKENRAKQQVFQLEHQKFYEALQAFKMDKNNIEKWDSFISEAEKLFSNETSNSRTYNSASWNVFLNYKKLNRPEALMIAKDWSFKGVELNPSDPHMQETYANILFEAGLTNEAVNHQEIAVNILREQNHEWTQMYAERLERFKDHLHDNEVKIGSKFIDVMATNLNGKEFKLSELINGKIAIVNFWASWSETSIAKNRKLTPIYNDYASLGLNIISIAGEFKTTKKMQQVLENENNQWINLVDLDRLNRVWDKYGVLNTGSRNFLVDEKGIILAIDPTEEELKKLLNKNL